MGPSRLKTAIAVGTAVVLAACADGGAPTRFLTPEASLGSIPNNKVGDGVVSGELVEVCKRYVGAVGPAVAFHVVGPGVDTVFNLADDECANVFINGGTVETATVTETVPAGYTASWIRTTTTGGVEPEVAGNVATGDAAGSPVIGSLIEFYNTEIVIPPPVSLEGRMTGGGVQFFGEARISRGFTIHCDITLSNNLEINWPGNKWHLDKPLTFAFCSDNPLIDHGPPAAPFDTFYGEGVGKLNGVDGAVIKFTFIDAGEPGSNDQTQIQIWDVNGNLVLDTPLSALVHGNIQAHYDQPHGNKP